LSSHGTMQHYEGRLVPDFPSLAPSTSIAALPFVFPSLSRGMYVISCDKQRAAIVAIVQRKSEEILHTNDRRM
jgi:hypothetical protein